MITLADGDHVSPADQFSLVVDQCGRLWLDSKLGGMSVDLGEANAAFQIMADTIAQNGFSYTSTQTHELADNDNGDQ
jgi:hypothetical protein